MMLRRSLNGVLGQLANEGLLSEEQLAQAKERGAARPPATPWFVRALVGAGAWVASWLVIAFFAVANLLDRGGGAAFFAVVFYVGALVARRLGRSDFVVQLSLSFGLSGASLLVFWVAEEFHGGNVGALVTVFVLGVVTVVAFPDVVARFLGTTAASVGLVLFFYEVKLGPDAAVALVGALAGLAWHFEARLLANPLTRPLQRPVAWGLLLSFLFAMLTTVFEDGDWLRVGPLAAVSAGVALAVVVLTVAQEHGARVGSEPVIVALLAVAALGAVTFHASGVLAALYALLLAFHRRSPVMLGVGVLFLVVFAVHFYFRMELTLLSRGLALLGSGALLFVAREYVRRRFGPIVEEELP